MIFIFKDRSKFTKFNWKIEILKIFEPAKKLIVQLGVGSIDDFYFQIHIYK